jgi:hypothetical protein
MRVRLEKVMTYKLTPITSEDMEKIIEDFSTDLYLKNIFQSVLRNNRFRGNWAVDDSHTMYLLDEPGIGRPEIDGRPYIFFDGNRPIRIASQRMGGMSFISEKIMSLLFQKRKTFCRKLNYLLRHSVDGGWVNSMSSEILSLELNQSSKRKFKCQYLWMLHY